MTEEQKEFAEKELALIRRGGHSSHSVWVANYVAGLGSRELAKISPPAVGICGDDHFYAEYFNTRAELEAFVAKLRAAADEAWGEA